MHLSQPQYDFLSSPASWVVYGGAAGGGKSHAISLDPLRHCQGPHAHRDFRGALFRRTYPQLSKPGGLLDHCKSMYAPYGATFNHTASEFRFKSGAKLSLNTLQFDKDLTSYQGAQFDYLGIDEANQFTLNQILFLWGRCRSKSGIKPVLRMTSNPDNDSFLFPLVLPWLNPSTGYPDRSQSGVIRHFTVADGRFIWHDDPQLDPLTHEELSTSFTFIPATLSDNTHLLESDPSYRRRLESLPDNDRERFLEGCWLASSKTDTEWPRELFLDLYVDDDQFPSQDNHQSVRMFAVDPSKGRSTKKGDYSAIVCLTQTSDLGYIDADLQRRPPGQIVEDLFLFCQDPLHRIRSGDLIGVESLQFQSLFRDMILQYAADHPSYALSTYLSTGNPIVAIEDSLNKMMRIRRLDVPFRQRRFRFRRNPSTTLLLQQAKLFDGAPGVGKYDDGLDALDMCQQLPVQLTQMFERNRKT